MAGEGVCGVVLDEFSLMAENVWTEYVSSTLLDYDGWALFLGVPKGRNWAFHLWSAARARSKWRMAIHSYDNPKIARAAIDELCSTLPERLVRQEILAEIIDDSAAVFRNIRQLAVSQTQPAPIAVHRYNIGVDWGRSGDYTVLTVFDATARQVCYLDRFTGLPFETQLGKSQPQLNNGSQKEQCLSSIPLANRSLNNCNAAPTWPAHRLYHDQQQQSSTGGRPCIGPGKA
ncbi:MAG: hypothetical protein R2867_19815 [Caldilineaceae bacterium]